MSDKCGNSLNPGLLDNYDKTLQREHVITAGADIDVTRIDQGSYDEDIIAYNPYTEPVINVSFIPSILEEGLTPPKSDQKVQFQVEKGKNEVNNIKSANFGIDIDNPVLPYDSGQLDHYGTGDIGEAEELTAQLKVNDGIEYTATKTQKRGYRAFYGVASSPSITGDGAMAAADTEEILTGIPGDQSFDCGDGGYWFVGVKSTVALQFSIGGFIVNPVLVQENVQPIDGNSYTTGYNFYISPAKNTGIVEVKITNG